MLNCSIRLTCGSSLIKCPDRIWQVGHPCLPAIFATACACVGVVKQATLKSWLLCGSFLGTLDCQVPTQINCEARLINALAEFVDSIASTFSYIHAERRAFPITPTLPPRKKLPILGDHRSGGGVSFLSVWRWVNGWQSPAPTATHGSTIASHF